jgi:hypothetical protein
MNIDKKKDALTDLVDIVSSQPDNQQPNNGTVSTASGEKIELGFDAYIKNMAKKIVSVFKKHSEQEREVLEQIVKKNYERKKTRQ